MTGFKDADFGDRLSDAANARKALMEKFRTRSDPHDPAVQQRKAERETILAARAIRDAKREAARKEHEKRLARERAERVEAERRAQAERQETERLAAIEREKEHAAMLELEGEREAIKKAERDTRYAARKARKKGLIR